MRSPRSHSQTSFTAPRPREPHCCLCWGLVLERQGPRTAGCHRCPTDGCQREVGVSRGPGGPRGIRGRCGGGLHHTCPSTGQALNKGSVSGTRLRVESGAAVGGGALECWGQGQSDCVSGAQCGGTPWGFLPASPFLPAKFLWLAASRPTYLAGEDGPQHGQPCQHGQVWGCCLLSGVQRTDLSLGARPVAPGVAARCGLAWGGRQEQGWVSGWARHPPLP